MHALKCFLQDEAEQEAEAAKVAAKENKTKKRKTAEGKAAPKQAKKPKVDGKASKRSSKPKRSSVSISHSSVLASPKLKSYFMDQSIIPSDLDEEDSPSAKTAKSGSSVSSNTFTDDGVSISSQNQVKDAASTKHRQQVGDEDADM